MRKVIFLIMIALLICFCLAEETEMSNRERVNAWKQENGYDFPFYGETAVDLSPISDYLSLLSENGIYITLPDLGVMKYDDHDWIYTKISDSMYLTYVYWFEGKDSLSFEVPMNYRPRNDALPILMVSMMGIEREEADKLYASLQYNVIDGFSMLEVDNYSILYFEYGDGTNGFQSLDVHRTFD